MDVAATLSFGSAKEAFAWGELELENVVALVERYATVSAYVPVLVRLLHPYPNAAAGSPSRRCSSGWRSARRGGSGTRPPRRTRSGT